MNLLTERKQKTEKKSAAVVMSPRRATSGYRQGFMVCLLIVEAGTLIEIAFGGRGVPLPSKPVNIIAGAAFLFLLLILHLFYRHKALVRSLSQVPSAISSIVLFTLLVLLMGLTKQNMPGAPFISSLTGLDHIRNSFTFLFSGIYLMTTLGLVTLRRMIPFSFDNIGFILNHAGLWIIIFSGSLGSGDIKSLQITVNENQAADYGYNYNYVPEKLPFTVRLLDFSIEEYPPGLAVISRENISGTTEEEMPEIKAGSQIEVAGWKISVIEFLPYAKRDSAGYRNSDDSVTYAAALVKAFNETTGAGITQWISNGNYLTQPEYIYLDDRSVLAMTVPEPREYSSAVEVTRSDGSVITKKIMVNSPARIEGWDLYQMSYDASMGKYSRTSVIEAVRDPWLPAIYCGIGMIMAGALYIFWIGRKPKNR